MTNKIVRYRIKTNVDKKELLNKLRRAYEMEEVMVTSLVEILEPEFYSQDIDREKSKTIQDVLLSIKSDSYRHKSIVNKMMQELKNE